MIEFGGDQVDDSFSADREWCLAAKAAVHSIHLKGTMVDDLLDDLDGVHASAHLLSKKIMSRLSSFVAPRVNDRTDLLPGRHWHWRLFAKQIQRISVLCCLSGHVPKDLQLREAHESYLGLPTSFFVVEGDLKDLDGSYIVEDTQRGTIIRAGATEKGFSERWRQHKKASELSGPTVKQRRFL